MKNWKTTLAGLFAALPQLVALIAPLFGFTPPMEIVTGVSAIGVAAIGVLAKDHNVTGGTIDQ